MEIIGRLIVAFLLMAVSAGVGAGCAGFVFLVLRMRQRPWRKAALLAFAYPLSATAYVLGCVVLSSALSIFIGTPELVFGDIHEALPNGYTIEALDKMPQCGIIRDGRNTFKEVAWVNRLQVSGPYVFGKYDYTCFSGTQKEANKNLFSLDTRTGVVVNFASQAELEEVAGVPLRLTATTQFKGPRTFWQRLSMTLFVVFTVIPPAAMGLWLIFRLVLRLRYSDQEPDSGSPEIGAP